MGIYGCRHHPAPCEREQRRVLNKAYGKSSREAEAIALGTSYLNYATLPFSTAHQYQVTYACVMPRKLQRTQAQFLR